MKNKTIYKWFSMLLLMMVAGISSATAQSLSIAGFNINAGDTKDVAITLATGENTIYGIQTDVVLSEGLSLEAAASVDGNLTLSQNTLESGAQRIALLSLNGAAIPAGDVITLSVTAAKSFKGGTVSLTNTRLTTTTAGTELKVDDVTTNVVFIEKMYLAGDFTGGWPDGDDWSVAKEMTQNAENTALWTYTLEGFKAEAKTYKYKVSAHQAWDNYYQLPENGDAEFEFGTEGYPAGKYNIVITANTEGHMLSLVAEPVPLNTYTATFENNGNWAEVYAYAWTTTGEGEAAVTTEFLGAWPGTKVEASDAGYVVTIQAEEAPEFIIFSNGSGLQTADLPFVDGSTYAYEAPAQTATFNFADPNFRENIGEAMTDTKGFIYNETFTADGVTLQITAGSAPSRIYVDANRGQNLVTYKEYATLTFNAPEGKAITKIEFTAAGNSNIKNFTASSGTIEDMTWTGNATGVRFQQGGTSYLANAIVTLEGYTDETDVLLPLEYRLCGNIAAFNALEAGTYAKLTLTDAEIIGKSADGYSTVFIQDATAGAWIQYTSLNDRLQESTKVNGTVYTIKRATSGNPQLKEAEGTPQSELASEAISGYTMAEGTIAEVNVAANLNKVVKISGAKLTMTSATAGTLELEGETIDVNNGTATANQQLHKIDGWEKDKVMENVTVVAILVAKSATANQLLPISIEQPVVINSMALVGDFTGGWPVQDAETSEWDWSMAKQMAQDAENPAIWTLTLEEVEVEGKKYEYKAAANDSWDGYQLPAEGNADFVFGTEEYPAGKYNLTFTANTEENTLTLAAEEILEPDVIDITWTAGIGNFDIAAKLEEQIAPIRESGNKVGNITIELAKGGEYTLGATLTAPNNIFIYGNDATIDASNCVVVSGEGEEATTSPAPFITLDGTDAVAVKADGTESDHKLIQSVEIRGVTIKGLQGALVKDNQKTFVENLVIDWADIEMPAAGKNVLDFNGKGYAGKVTVTNSTIWANGMNTGFFAQYGSRPKNINGDWLQEFDFENNTIVNIANGKNFCDLKQNGTAQNVYTLKSNIFVDCGKSGQTVVGFNKGQTSATPVWDVTGNYFEAGGECKNAAEIEKAGQKGGEDIVKDCVNGKVTFTDAAAGDFNGDFALTPGAKAPETLGAPMWTLNIVRTQAPFAATVKNDVDPAWEAVYAYTWTFEGETKVEQLGEWPGTQLTADAETGLYKVEGANDLLPEFIIFNNNAGAQTEDLAFVDGKEYRIFGEHEFAYQKYLVQNIASGKFWSAGNDWGTRASLVPNAEYLKLVPIMGEGKYNIESQVNNGGEQYYFNGDYMDSSDRAVVTVTNAGLLGYADKEETKPVYAYTIANGDSYYGWDGTSTILGKNLAAGSENALWVIVSLADAKAALANATADEPMDATFLVEDHNFGRNNRYDNRWEGTGLHKGGDNSNLNTESYMSAFDVYQTLSEVPNGVYELKAQAAVTYHDNRTVKEYDGEGAPVIYANDESSDFNEMMPGDQLQSQAKMSQQFNAGEYWVEPVFVQVTDGTLKVGAKCERADIWAVWDNFTLAYYGADADLDQVKNAAILAELAGLRDKANDILLAEELEVTSVQDALQKAYDETADVSGTDAIKAAIETLGAALDLAEGSLTAKDVLPKMRQLAETTNVYTEEAYEEYYGQWYQKYEAGTITKAEAGALQDPFVVTGWRASVTVDNFLLSAWDTNPDFQDAAYYINTWSTEGVEGYDNYAGAPFGVPFFEYWTGNDNKLGGRTLTATVNGLTAGWYDVTALVRVRAQDGYTAPAYGIKMQANNGDMTDVAAGGQVGDSQFYMATFTAKGEVGEDGVLKIRFIVAADNNISWLSFQNVNFAPGEAAPEYVYTVVGGFGTEEGGVDDVIFGKTWDPALEANDLVKGEDGLYTKKFENVELQAGTILYKVVRSHSWDINWGFDGNNADYVVNEAGKYNISFYFNPADKLENGFNVDCKVVDAITDGISDLIATEAEGGNVYNLNGQKVMKAKNGLYIVNGKKTVVK